MQSNVPHSAFRCPPAGWQRRGQESRAEDSLCRCWSLHTRLAQGRREPSRGGTRSPGGTRAPAEPFAFPGPSPTPAPGTKGSAAEGLHTKSCWIQEVPDFVGSLFSVVGSILSGKTEHHPSANCSSGASLAHHSIAGIFSFRLCKKDLVLPYYVPQAFCELLYKMSRFIFVKACSK